MENEVSLVSKSKFALYVFFSCGNSLVCIDKDYTQLFHVIRLKNIRIRPSTLFQIVCRFKNFLLESGFKKLQIRMRIRWIRVDERRTLL